MDQEAEFRRLYEASRASVHAYFTGRTGSPQQAADLMQDVFLRAWRHLDELTALPEDRQRAWIFTVARNLSVDAHRRESTRVGTEQVLAREPTDSQRSASTAVIAAERVAVVGEAIRRLPESQRVTLTMAAAGGMTSAELAEALGVPAGTVRYRLSLARRAVAEALARYDDPAEE
ncbi:MAG TPA: sigma-70 family RNA polymerase sigma factor [Streptosporangiaceae bacterium]|nr:sigma-70 family RNA polymerase sigma factor [Streptosporangiaceae bacterium]